MYRAHGRASVPQVKLGRREPIAFPGTCPRNRSLRTSPALPQKLRDEGGALCSGCSSLEPLRREGMGGSGLVSDTTDFHLSDRIFIHFIE